MSENRSSEKDEALSKLLRTWKPEAQLPPRFQETVWRRIECAETARTPSLLQTLAIWVERIFSRPALAASYVAILLVTGAGAGCWHAEDKTAQVRSDLRARYVQTVDPYQMPRN